MIDFACKKFSLDEVIKCGLSLTKADFNILKYLIKNSTEWFTSETISIQLKLNLTTVQRTLKKLYEKDIVIRNQRNLDKGGYIYSYQIRSKKEINTLIMKIINNWAKIVEHELEDWQKNKKK